MKYLILVCKVLIVSLAFTIVLTQYQVAQADATFTLSGRVTDEYNNFLPDTIVDVIDPNTEIIITFTSTNANGMYSLNVDEGIYNIRVTPPLESGLRPAVVLEKTIGADTNLDFVLVPEGFAVLSGKLVDPHGEGIPGQSITLFPWDGGTGTATTTDSLGNYSIAVVSGNYGIDINYYYGNSFSVHAPAFYQLRLNQSPISITQDTSLDLELPVKQVNVHVQDPAGNSLTNARLDVEYLTNSELTLAGLPAYGWNYGGGTSDASGNIPLWLFPTCSTCSYRFTAYPPEGSNLGTTNRNDITFASDISVTIELQEAVVLSGKLVDPHGEGIPGQSITLFPWDGGAGTATTTDSLGNYSIAVVSGNYGIDINYYYGNSFSVHAPAFYQLRLNQSPISITQDTSLDLELPVKQVNVHVQDPAGNSLTNARLDVEYLTNSELTLAGLPAYGWNYGGGTSDASGNIPLWLFPTCSTCSYRFTAYPPEGSNLGTTNRNDITFASDISVTIELQEAVVLSGKLVDPHGEGIPGQSITLFPWDGGAGTATTTDSLGNYSIAVVSGNYGIDINYYYGNSFSVHAPAFYQLRLNQSPISITQDTSLDLELPVKQVNVHVQDPAGNSLTNARLDVEYLTNSELTLAGLPAYGWNYGGGTSDASGNIPLWLFPTCSTCSYKFTVYPPAETPFATFTIRDVILTSDKSIIIALQFVHAQPSTTLALNPAPNPNGSYPGDVTATLTARAASGSSVVATYYSVDGGQEETYANPFVISGDGPHSIRYWSIDNSGVYETPKIKYFNIATLRIATEAPISAGTIGAPYSILLEADGGTPPYTWSISGGVLPPGLELNPTTGKISGTPTTAGVFGFTVQVQDSSQLVVTKQFNLAPPPASGNAGSDYVLPINVPDIPSDSSSGQLPVCNNYRLALGTLPDGITMDPVTGIISGIPLDGGTFSFTVECVDITNQTVSKDFTITIYNPLPTITQLMPGQIRTDTGDFTLTVLGTNFVQSSVVQWNGSSRTTTFVSTTELHAAIRNNDIGTSGTASVIVINPEPNGGLSNAANFTILPNNPPVIDAGGPYFVNEGSYIEVVASGSDPDGDHIAYKWDLNSDGVFETSGLSTTFSATNLDGPNNYLIKVKAIDDFGLSTTAQAIVIVINVVPTVGSITAPINPVQVNTAINTSINFTDPSMFDTHTAVWDWGDSSISAGIVTETNGSSSAIGSHTYISAGVYTAKITVTDDDGGFDTDVFQYVVIYDPNGGFVTGGGWINSPLGAYTPDPSLTGKATFGFVSKYQKGANVPTGNTEFQFHVANMNFKSTSYEWLVIAGTKAQYKGTGTINGAGEYKFMLTAIDDSPDKFRIKIWDKVTGEVIYDNQLGAVDTADPTTIIQGGSIVIHKAK